MTGQQTLTVEDRMAAACVAFATVDIPEAARRAADVVILDWLGCVLIGAEAAPALAIARAHAEEIGHGRATCFVGPSTCAPGLAALISGTAGHTLELDDIYSPALYHPAVCVISAALAACQSVGASGETFLRAVIAGYELSNRLGAAVNPEHYKFWHTTGTIGTIGAGVAASVALGLDLAQCHHALAHATTMAAGLQQAFRSDGMTKPLHAGHAAQSGLLAARLAKEGFVGSTEMISGPVGFIKAMSHGRDIPHAFDDLFQTWTVQRATFKRFSACGHTFAAVDAVLDLMQAQPIAWQDVERVEVGAYAVTAEVAAIPKPVSPFEAKFSTQFGVAATLLGHNLTDPTVFDRLYADAAIHALIPRVHIAVDDAITGAFPKLRGARVDVRMKNGASRALTMPTRKGDPGNPLTPDDLRDKFLRLLQATRHRARAADLIAWVETLSDNIALTADTLPLAAAAPAAATLRAV